MIYSADLTLGMPLSHGAFIETHLDSIVKLEQYLKSLEDERKKIEAFQRELPLCMQLLNDEIQASENRLAACHQPIIKPQLASNFTPEKYPNIERKITFPVLEEFIPLKKSAKESSSEDLIEEKERMVTIFPKNVEANLWRQSDIHSQKINDISQKRVESVHIVNEDIEMPKPVPSSQGRKGGAFLPFSGVRKPLSVKLPEFSTQFGDEDLSPCAYVSGRPSMTDDTKNKSVKETQLPSAAPPMPGQPQRKPRRCWSPELHRRFVNALQQLGGSEAATPKQIRELMKVDGLTNDEVKSHLQKYRLHTRRPNASFHAAAPHAPQLVVLGGIWVPPTTATQVSPKNNLVEHQVSHLRSPSFSKDHYSRLNSTNQMQIHPGFSLAPHSQDSSQGIMQPTRHSGDDESLGDDVNHSSSWKGGYHEKNPQCYDQSNSNMSRWRYCNESGADEDSEAEDGRVYETPT